MSRWSPSLLCLFICSFLHSAVFVASLKAQESITTAQLLDHWRNTALAPVQVEFREVLGPLLIDSRSPFGNSPLIPAGSVAPANDFVFTYIAPESMRLDNLTRSTSANIFEGQSKYLIRNNGGTSILVVELQPSEGELASLALTTTLLRWINPLASKEGERLSRLGDAVDLPIQTSEPFGDFVSIQLGNSKLHLARKFDWRPFEVQSITSSKDVVTEKYEYAYVEGKLVLKESSRLSNWRNIKLSVRNVSFHEMAVGTIAIDVPENTRVTINRNRREVTPAP